MFTAAYLDAARSLLQGYAGGEPFHLYLKRFFGLYKKFGSRDRRHITQLCYCWFRAAHALKHLDVNAQLRYALFLCSTEANSLLENLDTELNKEAEKSQDEKLQFLEQAINIDIRQLFPWNNELSREIAIVSFNRSLLIQPDLYLRLRPGREQAVTTTLQQNGIFFQNVSDHCLALPNSAKIDAVVNLDADAVVQDKNSQNVLGLLGEHGVLKKFTAWDCCAASGGKSLLLHDTFSNVHITVSDVRENILHNLRARFKKAGLKNYRLFVANAAADAPPQKFDLIICDAPCSGSGTWSRTPEQLHYFSEEKMEVHARLQKDIIRNVSQYLKPGGWLLYITCSVFKKENEDVVAFGATLPNIKFLKSTYYKGYDSKADTLFAALFKAGA